MNEWNDEWMNEWVNEWRVNECKHKKDLGVIDKRMNEWSMPHQKIEKNTFPDSAIYCE